MPETHDHWLATERLALRRFTVDDLDWLVGLYADADVTRFIGGLRTRTEVEDLLTKRALEYYDANPGLGMWITIERTRGEPVGFHLLNHIWGETIIQVGYALVKPAWGKGFATEMAGALVRYGFVDLGLARITGMADLDHTASHRVLEKIGLLRNGERAFSHPMYAEAGPLAWFERDAEPWLADTDQRRRLDAGSP